MKDLNEVINKIINKAVVGCDKYVHNDSTWLIFTDNKKWIIELTKDGTLWYNYDFFKNLFKVLSLDVVENQNYITKWVEETIINGVRNTIQSITQQRRIVEDTIENGVKETHSGCDLLVDDYIEDTIQNGVKYTRRNGDSMNTDAEDAIQNGVKEIHWVDYSNLRSVEDAIQNGVKHTEYGDWLDGDERFDDIIQNGVKETKTPGADGDILSTLEWIKENNTVNIPELINDVIEHGVKLTNSSLQIDGSCVVEDVIQNGIKETHDDVYHHKGRVGGVIKNGVKQCIPSHTPLYNPMDFSVVYRENHRLDDVASVLEKGIKEVQPLPSQEGNMDWGNYYHRQEDRTKPHTKYVDDVITNGIKKTKAMDEWVNTDRILDFVISNGTSI
jgi:predicted peroxiredoxin